MFTFKRIAIFAAPVLAAMLCGPEAAAAADNHKDVTVMGCLTKSDQGDLYQIKTDSGTFVLEGHGFKEKLVKHVGHIVTLTGSMDKEREKSVAGAPDDMVRFKISIWTKTGSVCQ
jgi:uncharacterized protein YdeI (BOF family)